MNRAEKSSTIEGLNKTFTENQHLILAGFSGLSSNQANALRRQVDAAGGSYRVIQNRLARLAAAGTPIEPLAEQFEGPCAVITHADDPVALAKVITGFIKENPELSVKSGIIDATAQIDPDAVVALSKMPALPELRAQMLALFQTPATMLVRLLGTPATQIARVIDANREKQGEDGE